MHHILTKVPFPCAAGISGVPWDGVELPSQYMEFFCYEREVVESISGHWKTGEKLPDDLFDKVVAFKKLSIRTTDAPVNVNLLCGTLILISWI